MISAGNDVIEGHEFTALKVGIDDQGILKITLARPERLNAFNDDMRAEFLWLTRRIEANPDIRVIVFTAEGDRAFCAGADVSWFENEWQSERFRIEYRSDLEKLRRAFDQLGMTLQKQPGGWVLRING